MLFHAGRFGDSFSSVTFGVQKSHRHGPYLRSGLEPKMAPSLRYKVARAEEFKLFLVGTGFRRSCWTASLSFRTYCRLCPRDQPGEEPGEQYPQSPVMTHLAPVVVLDYDYT